METILQVNSATVRFGGLVAVDQVSLKQEKGEILALIGPNGAGKTTFFNMLTGVYRPSEGTIFFNGENITKMKTFERTRIGIARTFQNIRLIREMTVLENILVAHPGCNRESLAASVLAPMSRKKHRREVVEQCESLLEIVGLVDQISELAPSLPYGKQRLLEIARALATSPRFLLLDEPGAGMNSFEKDELVGVIEHVTKTMGVDVLLIEHDMKFVMGISDRIVVLDHGVKIAEGLPEEIQRDQRVIQAYLGSGKFDDDDAAVDDAPVGPSEAFATGGSIR